MIKIPIKITPRLKKLIKESYSEAIKDFGVEEELYVHKKLSRKLRILKKHPNSWHADIANVAESLQALYIESLHHPRKLSKVHKQSILAALFYLCDPYDIIPDYTPGAGYVDDAYVFNMCLNRIKRSYPRMYSRILENLEESRK